MASTFRFVWDGNVLLHETFKKDNSENTELTTWVFEGFVPTAKLVNGKAYSIISDHLGTPILAIDSEGNEVWNRQLDIYGRVKREIKASSLGDDVRPFIPFHYQGQYYDFETKLAYNRFRYYSPETGAYISQDPIRLAGGNPTLYGYVKDSNCWVDVFGLDCENYQVSEKRKKHILEGDNPNDPMDGHGPNRGKMIGAFPDTWTDEQVISAIERVANSSNSTWKQTTGSGYKTAPITIGAPDPNAPSTTEKGTPTRFKVQGKDHSITIELIIAPQGERIITGYRKE